MSFISLGLHSTLLSNLHNLGYHSPTPVQLKAIPEILAKTDIMAGAQTGTGKTAAFALPILHSLLNTNATQLPEQANNGAIKALVLTPTRELAQQVHQSFVKYAQNTDVHCVAAYGGASINPQLAQLQQGCDVLVATPGRLLELLFKQLIDISQLQTWVLDEADRMLDMGFIIDIKRILRYVPEKRQTLLFSATFSKEVIGFSQLLLSEAKLIEVDQANSSANKVEQIIYQIDKHKKSAMLAYLIGVKNWQQVLIFTRTKQGADELAAEMKKDGISTQAIHGDKSQGARDRVLADFKNGKVRALVATDVAARGIDIANLQYVVNHELPYNAEDYIHRIGRTGRAGHAGLAVSLVSHKEQYLLDDIEKLLKQHFVPQWLEGFEPSQSATDDTRNKRTTSKKTMRAQALNGKNKHKRTARKRR